ncbi:MAG: hypothetical protein ACTHK0_05825 [Ginsengibacter sp.]
MEKKKKWLKVLASLLAITFIVLICSHILTSVIQKQVGEALKTLSPKIHTKFSSVHVDLFNGSVSVSNLHLFLVPATDPHQHSFYCSEISLTGINFFKLIGNQQLVIKTVSIKRSKIVLDEFLLHKNDSTKAVLNRLNIPFEKITIVRIKFESTNMWLQTDSSINLLLRGNFVMKNAGIFFSNKSVAFDLKGITGTLSDITYPFYYAHHAVLIKNVIIDSKKKTLKADSLRIVPLNDNKVNEKKQANPSTEVVLNVESVKISETNITKLLSTQKSDILSSEKDSSAIKVSGLKMRITFNSNQQYIFCPQVLLSGVHFEQVFSGHNVVITQLKSVGVQIKLNLSSSNKKTDDIRKNLTDLPAPLKSLSIKKIDLTQMKIWLHSRMLLNGNVAIEQAFVNNSDQSDRGFHFRAIKCNFSNISYSLPNGYYRIHIKGLLADSRKELLRIDSIQLIPQYSKFEFDNKLGHQADRIEATIAKIEFLKLNVIQLINKKLVADKVIINGSRFHIFRDRRLPRELERQPMVNSYLKKIPYEVRIHTFKLDNSTVEYEEFPKSGTESGILRITKINLTMSPVLNHPYKNDPAYCEMHVKGVLMDAGIIQANIRVPFGKNINYITGFIKNLDLPKLNSSAENLGNFHIESGLLNELDFHFTATEEEATGEIIGEYHNLVVDKLKSKKGQKKIAEVPSFFLKHLIIPKNKDKSMNVPRRTGKISYKRDPTRLLSYYFLKALLSGIESSFALGFLLPK